MPNDREFIPLITPQPAIPTVKIADDEAPDGFVIINASEFDKSKHKKYSPKAASGDAGTGSTTLAQ